MGRMSRQKGKRGERAIATPLRAIFGERVRRGWQTRAGSKDACDIEGTPYAVEVKTAKSISIPSAWLQALEGAEHNGGIPLVVAKWDRKEPLAVLSFDEFCRMVECLNRHGYYDKIEITPEGEKARKKSDE